MLYIKAYTASFLSTTWCSSPVFTFLASRLLTEPPAGVTPAYTTENHINWELIQHFVFAHRKLVPEGHFWQHWLYVIWRCVLHFILRSISAITPGCLGVIAQYGHIQPCDRHSRNLDLMDMFYDVLHWLQSRLAINPCSHVPLVVAHAPVPLPPLVVVNIPVGAPGCF